jgi:TolB protein
LSRKKSVLLLVLLLASSSAWSELIIRVTQGNDKPTMIAVPPIALNGIQIDEDIGRIVEGDLKRSGLFAAIPRTDMLAFPSTAEDVYDLYRRRPLPAGF